MRTIFTTVALLFILALCSQAQMLNFFNENSQAHPTPWFIFYSGDDTAEGVLSQGVSTPFVGGNAQCSAPYFGQYVGGYNSWDAYPCPRPAWYIELSYSISAYLGPDPPPNEIDNVSKMYDEATNTIIAQFKSYVNCFFNGPWNAGGAVGDPTAGFYIDTDYGACY